jgi:AraC-like DNA-binding protein
MEVAELAHLRHARDLLDREYARPLNVPAMAGVALMSPSLFARRFREAYGTHRTVICRPGGWNELWRCYAAATCP